MRQPRAVPYKNPKPDAVPVGGVIKIDRRCPRCGAHRNHFAKRLRNSRAEVACAECGHGWIGRLFRIEVA
jgi:ribosomal protein S27AE